MSLPNSDSDYFAQGEPENRKFWSRLGGEPRFEGLTVLDVGCGHGRLCVDVARSGARAVWGVDINERLIEYAKDNVISNYPQLGSRVNFHSGTIEDLPKNIEFDVILSKDSFEHIMTVSSTLAEMGKKLKEGGRIYIGFSPLYNSPYGGHVLSQKKWFPWRHLLLPERFLLKQLNKHRHTNKATNIYDLGLNKLSLAEFKEIFGSSGLRVTYFRVNASEHPMASVFSLLRRISILKEYFSYNLYCILEK